MAIKFQGFTHTASVQPSDLRPVIDQKGNGDSATDRSGKV